MARIIDRRFPLDQQNRRVIGFGFPLNGNAVFQPTYQTKDQIKANLINYILTNRGERVFNDFGANLRQFIFEAINDNTTGDIQDKIQGDISKYFPTVLITNFSFTKQEDLNTININIKYLIKDFGVSDEFNIQIA